MKKKAEVLRVGRIQRMAALLVVTLSADLSGTKSFFGWEVMRPPTKSV